MDSEHAYSRKEAQKVLDEFPEDKLEDLVSLASLAKLNFSLLEKRERIVLPEGWYYAVYGNGIIAAYKDGEQERKKFFVPQIWIQYEFVDEIIPKKNIVERLPLGYCSCGKRMRLAQVILWGKDMVERKGFWSLPSKVIGYTVGFFIVVYINLRPIHKWSLMFNRHPDCL